MVKSERWGGSGREMSKAVKSGGPPSAPQAQWNVQVVRGKVTTRCLWNACKALSVGLLLLAVGTTMAVIGYYADQLSIRSETRGNSTVKIRNESRGFHLNNLSYAGPIVMGIGGFIVVAACVMTFEARDSAAKVVPARFKPNLNASILVESAKTTPRTSRTLQRLDSKRCASAQTAGGGRSPGIYGVDSARGSGDWSPKKDSLARRAFTAAFVQFSRELMENSASESSRRWKRKISEINLNKSPSAPDLTVEKSPPPSDSRQDAAAKGGRRQGKAPPRMPCRSPRDSVRPLDTVSSNLLLRPSYLHRQALSMDNPFYDSYECCTPPAMRLSRQHSRRSGGSRDSFDMELGSSAGVSGSQASMALDLHDCQVTLKVKDESASKRSDTARRHQLLRQKPVEDDVLPRCSYASRFLCTPVGDEYKVTTKSSTNLQSPCHHCPRATASCSGRSRGGKITADLRSQSFSLNDPKRCKVFCVDDHRRGNRSSENVKLCCEEKLRLLRRHSPCGSPRPERRVLASECLLHRASDRRNRKGNQKMEASLSAEERSCSRGRRAGRARSASFSPTRKASGATSLSREGSSSPGKQSCSSDVAVEGVQPS